MLCTNSSNTDSMSKLLVPGGDYTLVLSIITKWYSPHGTRTCSCLMLICIRHFVHTVNILLMSALNTDWYWPTRLLQHIICAVVVVQRLQSDNVDEQVYCKHYIS